MSSVGSSSGSWKAAVVRGGKLLLREKRWSSTLVMLCCAMVLLQMLVAGLVSMKGVSALLVTKSGVHVEVLKGASDQDVQTFYNALRDLPYMEEVTYVPKEKAYELEKQKDPGLIQSIEKFQLANPFPDTFSVVLTSLDSFDEFLKFVNQAQWKGVIDPSFVTSATSQAQDVRTYLSVAHAATSLALWVLWIGIVALVLLIVDIALQRAHERRDELILETVLGASPMQVLIPFAIELGGLLIVSLIVGFAITTLFLLALPALLPAFAQGGSFSEARAYIMPLLVFVFPLIAIGEVLLMPLLGFVSGMIAIKLKAVAHPAA